MAICRMTNAPRIQRYPGAARDRAAVPQGRGRVRPERLKDWREPEEQSASHTSGQGEAENAGVQREVDRRGNHEGVEQRCAHPGDKQRPERAQDPQEHGFGEPLTNEPRSPGPNRHPHGDFPLARHGAREQQARDIHARDQEHHQHGTGKRAQNRPGCHAEASALANRHHGKAPVTVGLRVRGLEAAGDDVSARRRLVDAAATRQPADHAQSARTAQVEDRRVTTRAPHGRRRRIHFGLQGGWDPDVGRHADGRAHEPWRRDPDERVRVAVEVDRLADRRLVAVEHPLPERMRDDRDTNGRSDSIVAGHQPTADSGVDPKSLEVIAGDELPGERFRRALRVHGD